MFSKFMVIIYVLLPPVVSLAAVSLLLSVNKVPISYKERVKRTHCSNKVQLNISWSKMTLIHQSKTGHILQIFHPDLQTENLQHVKVAANYF